jgi:phosphohistidine phosphatase
MERKLLIVRHGKSSWETIVDDIDRPLTERGVKNAYEMARRIKDDGNVPDAIYSSPANRALHTAIIMARVWEIPENDINISRDLYLPDEDDIFSVISGVPDEIETIAIFGHNPGFTDFANRFLNHPVENIPTAGIALLTMDLESWTGLVNATVTNEFVDYPKKFR